MGVDYSTVSQGKKRSKFVKVKYLLHLPLVIVHTIQPKSRRGVNSLSLKIYLTTCLGNEQKEILQKFRDLDSKD